MLNVEKEINTQEKVKSWMIDGLGYNFLGNLAYENNKCIKPELLQENLKKRGYKKEQIAIAISELENVAGNQVDGLYEVNKRVYSLLRYGKQGVKDNDNNRQTVSLYRLEKYRKK
ncbi:MAG: hypothetical protein ACOX2O_08795 [Bdellovibrionota bacterium]